MFTLKKKKIITSKNLRSSAAPAILQDYRTEKAALLAALFLLAFGLGLISDGKKLYARQLKVSQRVDYKATLNPYTN
jgi:hypothetical protein